LDWFTGDHRMEFLIRNVLLPMPPQDGSILLAAGVEWLLFFGLIGCWIPFGHSSP